MIKLKVGQGKKLHYGDNEWHIYWTLCNYVRQMSGQDVTIFDDQEPVTCKTCLRMSTTMEVR